MLEAVVMMPGHKSTFHAMAVAGIGGQIDTGKLI
jgi:hypothetical protein